MSEDEKAAVSKELAEKLKSPDLAHAGETRRTPSTVDLVLKCTDCDHKEDFPYHCDEKMDYVQETKELECSTCHTKIPVPTHHNKSMVPYIVGA